MPTFGIETAQKSSNISICSRKLKGGPNEQVSQVNTQSLALSISSYLGTQVSIQNIDRSGPWRSL